MIYSKYAQTGVPSPGTRAVGFLFPAVFEAAPHGVYEDYSIKARPGMPI
jgi:hypothetical protein